MMVARSFDAVRFNHIINDPSIYPWVKGPVEGPLDLTPVVADSRNHLLAFEHGSVLFSWQQPGIYRLHPAVLPPGRGAAARANGQDCLHYIFTATDAVEIIMAPPRSNVAACAFAKRLGFTSEFVFDTTQVLSLRLQEWLRDAPEIADRGETIREQINDEVWEYDVDPWPENEALDRHLGACFAMLEKQPEKALIFFNRFASVSTLKLMSIITLKPLMVDIGGVTLIFRNNNFWVAAVKPRT